MEVKECPQCGAPVNVSGKKCEYCGAEFFISSLAYLSIFNDSEVAKYLKYYKNILNSDKDNIERLLGLGLCYLRMKSYILAKKIFEKIIETSPEISQAYYYFSLSAIAGKRIRSMSLKEIRQIEEFLQTAMEIDTKPQYTLLLSMIKGDYYEANGMKINGFSKESLLFSIKDLPIETNELQHLISSIKVGNLDTYLKFIETKE